MSRPVIKFSHHGKRWGFMLSRKDQKSMFGKLGSKSVSWYLDFWRNPR